ncbi:hypothetical protein A2Y26_00230 [candidate division CPR2 bacterium GWD2_39_7]|nr:MAG: hypothetical protein A2Y26_00230 [candidate division CPR2 bacterium GWD2_39_7]
MNPILIIKYQLYLLQLENYELGRYWKLILKKGYFRSKQPLRKELVWTNKTKIIFLISVILIGAGKIIAFQFGFFAVILWLVFALLSLPLFFTIALVSIIPVDLTIKKYLIGKAKKIIKSKEKLIIIGIAGSYGKTTMKNVLTTILETHYKVLATPESVNTSVGIARWLLNKFDNNTEILIIEMGEHYKGDIKYLCSITPPDIAVLTGINEAHIERLGSIKTSISTMFELVENARKDALIILNADDENIKKNYKGFTEGKNISFYSYKNDALVKIKIKNKKFDPRNLVWTFDADSLGTLSTSVLGEYILGHIINGITVSKYLNLNDKEIKMGIFRIKPVEHRLQPIKSNADILVIDDSYNGNPDGVMESIELLDKFKDRRKLFITPGLVETGDKAPEVHQEIGRNLAKVATQVILIRNSVTPFIEKGLAEGNFDTSQIIWFDTAEEAHQALGGILKPNDVILFQNDWGDQYV